MADKVVKKEFKAVLIGATGATGKYLFAELLKAKEFTKIISLGRRKAALPDDVTDVNLEEEEKSGRLLQEIVDFENINQDSFGKHFQNAHVFFSTFGTTRRAAGSAANFKHIDYGYNMELAKVARESGVRMFSLMSSRGADQNSYFLYLNSKGKLENDCKHLEFPIYSVFRPGVLNRGSSERYVEKVFGFFINRIKVQQVAQAMCSDALSNLSGVAEEQKYFLYYDDQIKHMSETYVDVNLQH